MNLAKLTDRHDNTKIALVDGSESFTYADVTARSAAVRSLLVERGIGPGDRVAIPTGNEAGFISAALGVLGVGACAIPMKPTSPVPELERMLASIRPDAMIVCGGAAWILDHPELIDSPMIDMRQVPLSVDNAPPVVERAADDIAFMMLTSGVSGHSKVAALSHGNLTWAQQAVIDCDGGVTSDDITLAALPFAHIFGLNVVLLAALRVGAKIVLQQRFDVDSSIDLVREHQISVLAGAPPMWQRWAMLDAPADAFSTVRIALSGAAALPLQTFEAFKAKYGVEIGEGYGMTETSSVITTPLGRAIRAGSVGRPLDGIEVLLVEEDGTPVEVGDAGEIVVRGEAIFQGYFDDQETTDQVLTSDGWFWTGDVGVVDDDGYLFLVDRVKDIIIVSGFNVYPTEVEQILREHPDVTGAVVVGAPDTAVGETVVAHVTGTVDEAELADFAAARLSRYKCPTTYHLATELPVAPTGKVIRRELRS